MDEPNNGIPAQDDTRKPLAEQRAAALNESRRLQQTHKQLVEHVLEPPDANPSNHPEQAPMANATAVLDAQA